MSRRGQAVGCSCWGLSPLPSELLNPVSPASAPPEHRTGLYALVTLLFPAQLYRGVNAAAGLENTGVRDLALSCLLTRNFFWKQLEVSCAMREAPSSLRLRGDWVFVFSLVSCGEGGPKGTGEQEGPHSCHLCG